MNQSVGSSGNAQVVELLPSPATDKRHAVHTRLIVFDEELGEAITCALTAYNVGQAKAKQPPVSWNAFVVGGLLKHGLDAFFAMQAEAERAERLVLSADEVRTRR